MALALLKEWASPMFVVMDEPIAYRADHGEIRIYAPESRQLYFNLFRVRFPNDKLSKPFWAKYSRNEFEFDDEVSRGIFYTIGGDAASIMRGLPRPPKGYVWNGDSGGLIMPNVHHFRLWHSRLGYMPGSE